VSNKPNKPIREAVEEFNRAWTAGMPSEIYESERELDKILWKRLRRARYQGYPKSELEYLLDILPQEYRGSDKVYDLWKKISLENQ
jgi:hypothetical protein